MSANMCIKLSTYSLYKNIKNCEICVCVKGNRLKYWVGISNKLGDCDWDERILRPLRIWEECTDSDWTLDFTMLGMLLEISGEITPERMKGWSQSKNNTQPWM